MQFTAANRNQIIIPQNADFDTTRGTMMFWMRSAGTSGNGNEGATLLDRRTQTGDVLVQYDDGTIFWQPSWLYGANTWHTVSDDRWHHVAYVFDQSTIGAVSVYIDGQWDKTVMNPNGWTWGLQPIEIGLSHDPYWRAYDGQMDDLRFYNRQLTANEILQVFTGDQSPGAGALWIGRAFDGSATIASVPSSGSARQ